MPDRVVRTSARDLIITAAAAYRLWRLAGFDDVTAPVRDRINQAAANDDTRPRTATAAMWASDLIECPWCLGSWVAFASVAALRCAPRRWQPVAEALAAAALVGAAHHVIERIDR